jgi:hypothetical protein
VIEGAAKEDQAPGIDSPQRQSKVRNGRVIALGVAASLASAAPAAEAQVFKCKDAEGKVTYTDVPCLRSEASSVVDTRANVADHSSIRKEAGRLQSNAAQVAPQSRSQSSSPEPPATAQAPAPSRVQRSSY